MLPKVIPVNQLWNSCHYKGYCYTLLLLHPSTRPMTPPSDTIQHYEKPCGYTPSLLPFLVTLPCCFP